MYDKQTKLLIEKLDSTLKDHLSIGASEGNPFPDFNCISDEVSFWNQFSRMNPKDEQRCNFFIQSLKSLDVFSLSFQEIDLLEEVDKLQETLNDMWQTEFSPPYPADRMQHLLHTIVNDFMHYIISIAGNDMRELNLQVLLFQYRI